MQAVPSGYWAPDSRPPAKSPFVPLDGKLLFVRRLRGEFSSDRTRSFQTKRARGRGSGEGEIIERVGVSLPSCVTDSLAREAGAPSKSAWNSPLFAVRDFLPRYLQWALVIVVPWVCHSSKYFFKSSMSSDNRGFIFWKRYFFNVKMNMYLKARILMIFGFYYEGL